MLQGGRRGLLVDKVVRRTIEGLAWAGPGRSPLGRQVLGIRDGILLQETWYADLSASRPASHCPGLRSSKSLLALVLWVLELYRLQRGLRRQGLQPLPFWGSLCIPAKCVTSCWRATKSEIIRRSTRGGMRRLAVSSGVSAHRQLQFEDPTLVVGSLLHRSQILRNSPAVALGLLLDRRSIADRGHGRPVGNAPAMVVLPAHSIDLHLVREHQGLPLHKIEVLLILLIHIFKGMNLV